MDLNEQPSYMIPFNESHSPFNILSITEFYIYLLIAFVGLCMLFWAGYCQFTRRNKSVVLFIGGMTAIGVSFFNISSVKLSETNFFIVGFLMFIHGITCWMIVEGSTRYFTIRHEKIIKKQNDLDKARLLEDTYKNIIDNISINRNSN